MGRPQLADAGRGWQSLCASPRWVTWRLEQPSGRSKATKAPFVADAKERRADACDPDTWRPHHATLAHLDRYDGIGIVLGNGLCGVDLDGCRDATTGAIASWAQEIIERLDSYTEVSPSGTGVHILCFAELPHALVGNQKKLPDGGAIEIYDRARYFTVTGQHLTGTPLDVEHRTAPLAALHHHLFGEKSAQVRAPAPQSSSTSDGERLQVAFSAQNGAVVRALFDGGYVGHPTPSEADAALAASLAFYSDGDAAMLERLMRQSRRVRAKWEEARGAETWISRECRLAIERHAGEWWAPRPDQVRIDRRLLNAGLSDETLYLVALIAAGVADDDLATIAGSTDRPLSDRTLRRWWNGLDGKLEALARTRPTKRYVEVPRAAVLDVRLPKAATVTLLQLAVYMRNGRTKISQEALGKRRGREPARVGEDLRAAVDLGHLCKTEPARFCGSGKRETANSYWWNHATAVERPVAATDTKSRTRGARSVVAVALIGSEHGRSGHEERVTTEVHPQGGERPAVVVSRCCKAQGSTPPPLCEAEPGPEGGGMPLPLPPTRRFKLEDPEVQQVAAAIRRRDGWSPDEVTVVLALNEAGGDLAEACRLVREQRPSRLSGPPPAPSDLHLTDEMLQAHCAGGWCIPPSGPALPVAKISDRAQRERIGFAEAYSLEAQEVTASCAG